MNQQQKTFRRIVTGHDAEGKATIVSDAPPVHTQLVDIAGFGEPFIANPDLVERLQNNRDLTPPDRSLHYGLGMHGYIDWETYKPSVKFEQEASAA